MITEKDFEDKIIDCREESICSEHDEVDPTSAAKECFGLAKKMAFEYHKFATDYHRIEGQNVRHYCNKRFNGGMISWIGADDNKIFEAYLKGEQLEAEWVREMKEKNKDQ